MITKFLHLFLLFFSVLLLSSGAYATSQHLELQSRTPVEITPPHLSTESRNWLEKHRQLNIAVWGVPHPPLYMGYDYSRFEGVVADFLTALESLLGSKLNILHFDDFNQAREALAEGRVDILGMATSHEIAPGSALISAPYFFDYAVLVHKKEFPFIQGHYSLKSKNIAFVGGEHILEQLKATYPGAKYTPHRYYTAAMAALAYGSADALWINAATAGYLAIQGIESHAIIDRSPVDANASLVLAVAPGKEPLLDALNASIQAIPAQSRVQIASNWGLDSSYVIDHSPIDFTAEETAWLRAHPQITVWLPRGQAPLSFTDDDGHSKGYILTLLKLISERTRIQFIPRMLPEDGHDFLPDNSSDVLGVIIKDAQNDTFQYSNTFAFSPWVLVLNQNALQGMSLTSLDGHRVAIAAGMEQINQLRIRYPRVRFIRTTDMTHALQAIKNGEVSAAIGPQIAADYLIRNTYQAHLTVAGSLELMPARYALGFSQNNLLLQGIINKVLVSLPPQIMQRELTLWQNYQAPAHFSVWDNYGTTLIRIAALVLLLATLVWIHTRRLRRSLTEKNEYQGKLRDQLSFTRTLIDDSPVALYVRNKELRLMQCNRTYLDFLNVTAEQVVGKTIDEAPAVALGESKRLESIHRTTMSSGEPNFVTTEIIVDGRVSQIYLWSLPWFDHHGKISGIIGGFMDITDRDRLVTELQRARRQAEQANASKSLFLSQMSHEIRTPMNAVIGLLELELKGGSSPQKREHNIMVAWEAAKSLLSLVGDVLDLAKIESGARPVLPGPVDLPALLKNCEKLFTNAASSKGISLRTRIDVKEKVIESDALMLTQIVSNLISNAIKFTERGYVELYISQKERHESEIAFDITVKDTGIGLNSQQQLLVFEPFIQIEQQVCTQKGTGLGLSICRQLAERLGGQLKVTSTPGEGSAFTFSFTASPSTEAVQFEHVQRNQVTAESRRILIIDDHKPNRLLLRQQLEFAGHQVTDSDNATAALACWESAATPFHLILTDIHMPEMDGYTFTQELRKREKRFNRAPVTVYGLTAMAEPEIIERAKSAGMNDCLFKPIELDRLLSKVGMISTSHALEARGSAVKDVLERLRTLSAGNPSSLHALCQTLVETNQQDLAEFWTYRQSGDVSKVREIIHRIGGSARIAGASELMRLCNQIEEAAENLSGDDFIKLSEKLENELNALHHELQRPDKKPIIADVVIS